MKSFDLNADMVCAAAMCVSRLETRYYLQGVFVEPAPVGAYLVATDGIIMAVFHDAKAKAERAAIISSEWGIEAFECEGMRLQFDLPDEAGGEAAIGLMVSGRLNYSRALIAEIHGRFPDWRKVMPGATPENRENLLSIDPRRLRQITRSARRFMGYRIHPQIRVAEAEKPACIVTFDKMKCGFYLLMTCATVPDTPRLYPFGTTEGKTP